MRLIFFSPNFLPMIGGLENIVADVAASLSEMGVRVTVVTSTPNNDGATDDFPFKVMRRAPLIAVVREARIADFFVQFNPSLMGVPAWLLSGRPLVIVHQSMTGRGLRERLKRLLANHLSILNIGCSRYIADHYRRPMPILNAYDETLFSNEKTWAGRPADLVFVGRLVSEKGCDTLLNALFMLKKSGKTLTLGIVGDGPEAPALRVQARGLGIEGQIVFYGSRRRADLNSILNEHKIMVVPSLYREPFGIVALEGLAAGCAVIVSHDGGLREAVGMCGLAFPNGDAPALARTIEQVFADGAARDARLVKAPQHLLGHARRAVAGQYLAAFERLARSQRP